MENKALADLAILQVTENRAQALPDSLALPPLILTDRVSGAYGIDEEELPQTRGEQHDAT
jgi:hypothetical protein